MKPNTLFAALAALCVMNAAGQAMAEALPPAGLAEQNFRVEHRKGKMSGALWFPSDGSGKAKSFGENGVFFGTPVHVRSEIKSGAPMPLVLLSHGLGGNIRAQSWLAAGLAARGALVVSINHPDSTTRDFDLAKGLDHGTRAEDLSALLDQLLADDVLGPLIDRTRIMASGFSLGGWTALSLAGLRGNLDGYAAHCDEVGTASTHCNDITRGRVDLRNLDELRWNRDYQDRRVTHVSALDPGLTWGLDMAAGATVSADVQLIALGAGPDRLLAADVDRSGLLDVLPTATIKRISPANHHTALLTCKPKGAAILKAEKDDPVCDDPAGTDRAAVHAEIIDAIAAQLGL